MYAKLKQLQIMYPPLEGQEDFVYNSDVDDVMSDISELSYYSSTGSGLNHDLEFGTHPQSVAEETTTHEAKSTDVGTDSKKNSDLEADVSFDPSMVSVFSQKTNSNATSN